MDHYYNNNSNLESKPKLIEAVLRNKRMKFKTDIGVFSKNNVDFGTRLLVNQFSFSNKTGAIADIGCGYGPLGITLAKETTDIVYMVDVNDRAVDLAKQNANLNGVTNVEILLSNSFEKVPNDLAYVLTNPPVRAGKKVVQQIIQDAYKALSSNGELWVVLQKKQGAPSAKKLMETMFSKVEINSKSKGYYILRAVK